MMIVGVHEGIHAQDKDTTLISRGNMFGVNRSCKIACGRTKSSASQKLEMIVVRRGRRVWVPQTIGLMSASSSTKSFLMCGSADTVARHAGGSHGRPLRGLAQRMAASTCVMRCLLTGPEMPDARAATAREKSRCCSCSQSNVVAETCILCGGARSTTAGNSSASKQDHEQPSGRTPWSGATLFRPIPWKALEE